MGSRDRSHFASGRSSPLGPAADAYREQTLREGLETNRANRPLLEHLSRETLCEIVGLRERA